MHPVRYTRWVYRLTLAGVLLGLLIAGSCAWVGATELALPMIMAGPLVLGALPWVVGMHLLRPRCPHCHEKVRYMPGRRVAWFCPPCKRVYQTDVAEDSDSSD